MDPGLIASIRSITAKLDEIDGSLNDEILDRLFDACNWK